MYHYVSFMFEQNPEAAKLVDSASSSLHDKSCQVIGENDFRPRKD